MVDDLETRWRHCHVEIPKRMGKMSDLDKFDNEFFGLKYAQSQAMDPQGRMFLEHAYETIVDAGINPKKLRGTRTGVFIGVCFVESDRSWLFERKTDNGDGIIG